MYACTYNMIKRMKQRRRGAERCTRARVEACAGVDVCRCKGFRRMGARVRGFVGTSIHGYIRYMFSYRCL